MEQPAAISRALNYGGRILDEYRAVLGGLDGACSRMRNSVMARYSLINLFVANKTILQTVRHLIIAACGTSYFAGIAGSQYMKYLNSFETVQGGPHSKHLRVIIRLIDL